MGAKMSKFRLDFLRSSTHKSEYKNIKNIKILNRILNFTFSLTCGHG